MTGRRRAAPSAGAHKRTKHEGNTPHWMAKMDKLARMKVCVQGLESALRLLRMADGKYDMDGRITDIRVELVLVIYDLRDAIEDEQGA